MSVMTIKQCPSRICRDSDTEYDPSRSLFTLYPQDDHRLIYQKYRSDAGLSAEKKSYAGYFVNLHKLGKSTNKLQVQYTDSQSIVNTEQIADSTSLVFDSRFESGNLFAAFRIKEKEYDLVLQNDINSRGNTQWFFFSVRNTRKGDIVKFNLVNLVKVMLLT